MSARSEPSGPGGRRARILIVDDEPLNVDWLEQELAALGFETDSAGNGVEALDRIADRTPDLVLLDVMMPVMDGIAALRILKEDPETRLVPVVVMTALSEVDDRVRAIEAGADDFLSKPVDDRELRARINTALRTKWAIDATFSELRSAADHLERSGREVRDVVVVAVELGFADVTDTAATSFVLRRQRAAASQLLEAHGGKLAGDEPGLLLAVFDAADAHVRARAGAEAALAVSALAADPDSRSGRGDVALRVGIDAGRAVAGVARSANDPSRGWVYTVDGRPAQSALELVRAVQAPEIAVGERAAGLLGDAFRLERPSDGDVPYLLRSASDSGEPVGVRVLATILVTDIVGSTEHVERLGDHAWTELLEATNASFRREFERHLGEEVDTRGDGFLVLFAHPAQAIRCGVAIHERAAERGLAIRVGIHTGEVERVGDTVRGIAVHLVARVADEAEAGEVLVTGTTRDLVAGSGLELEDRGEHELKGVAEPRRLFAVVTN